MHRAMAFEREVFELESRLIKRFVKIMHNQGRGCASEEMPREVRKALINKFHLHNDRRGIAGTFIDSFVPAFMVFLIKHQTKKGVQWVNGNPSSLREFMLRFPDGGGAKFCRRVIKYLNSKDMLYVKKVISTQEGQLFLHRWSSH